MIISVSIFISISILKDKIEKLKFQNFGLNSTKISQFIIKSVTQQTQNYGNLKKYTIDK